jgi:hypothetical protein
MKVFIDAEENEGQAPRAAWEGALDCYLRSILYGVYHMVHPYDETLIAEQLKHIASLPRGKKLLMKEIKRPGCRDKLAAIDDGNAIYALTYEFVLCGDRPFLVSTPQTLDMARWLLERFKTRDTRLATALREAIMAGIPVIARHGSRSTSQNEPQQDRQLRELLIRMQ